MSPKSTVTITGDSPLMQFLKTPPAKYRQTDPDTSLNVVVALNKQSTTFKWAQENLYGATLKKQQWNWRGDRTYHDFVKFVNNQISAEVPVVHDIPFEYPRDEADVGVAIDTQVLLPIWSAGKSWIPDPTSCPTTKGLIWACEMLSEAYRKVPSGQQPAGSAAMEPQEGMSSDLVIRVQSATPAIESSGAGASAHVVPRPTVGGVRIDKIYTLSYQGLRPKPPGERIMRSDTHVQAVMKASPPHSSHKFLKLDQIWGIDNVTDEDHLKTLLPVELKRHGVIRKVILEEIALHQYELSGLNSTNIRTSADAARLKMTVVILQQAIRYGDHYGARFVMASTYYDSFILDLASDGEDVGSAARRIRWSFVDHEHIKLAVAYLFWRACSKIQKKLADVSVAIGMGQGKKK